MDAGAYDGGMLAADSLTDDQHRWNLMDSVLNRWEALRSDYATAMRSWVLPTFIARTFPDWNVVAILREQGAAAACLRHDDTLISLDFTWPKGCSQVQTLTLPPAATNPDPVDEKNTPLTARIIRCDIDQTLDDWREGAFDTGLTESFTGRDPIEMIDALFPAQPYALTGRPRSMPYMPGIDQPPLRHLLAIEALLMVVPDDERAAARMLLALRGLSQRTGYDQLA